MNPPRITETPAAADGYGISPTALLLVSLAMLLAGLGIGYVARGAAEAPSAAAADSLPIVMVDTSAPVLSPPADSPRATPPEPPTFALLTARRVLGDDVVDAVMYIDPPARRRIVALTHDGPDTTGIHAYDLFLLADEDGTYRAAKLPLELSNSLGRAIGAPADDGEMSKWEGYDTGRLWGVEDVDGDGRSEIWSADQMFSARGLWSLALTVYFPASGRTLGTSFAGNAENETLPQPEGFEAGTPPRVRDWMRTRGAMLAHPLVGSEDPAGRARRDAVASFMRQRPWGWHEGPVPRIEVPYALTRRIAALHEDCTRDGIHFDDGEDMLWRDDVGRRMTWPIYHSTAGRVESLAIGRLYLWMADLVDAPASPRVVAYDIRGDRLVNVPVPGVVSGAGFSLRGDTLYLGDVPFRVPAAYGGDEETRGAVVCGGEMP